MSSPAPPDPKPPSSAPAPHVEGPEEEPLTALDRPSPQAALVLLVPAAICSGLFYLWLQKPAESIVYGSMIGGGLAAMGLEVVKYTRWLRENPGMRDTTVTGAVIRLLLGAFRLGFRRTAIDWGKAFAQLFGLKLLASLVVIFLAFLAARAGHWF